MVARKIGLAPTAVHSLSIDCLTSTESPVLTVAIDIMPAVQSAAVCALLQAAPTPPLPASNTMIPLPAYGVSDGSLELHCQQLKASLISELASVSGKAGLPSSAWRQSICLWLFKVVDHFEMKREAVWVAMNTLDRFATNQRRASLDALDLSPNRTTPSLDSRTYQLSAIACLLLAIKTTEDRRLRNGFKLSTLVQLSRGEFDANDIQNMERRILANLNWKISLPTPRTFVFLLLQLVPTRSVEWAGRGTSQLVKEVVEELAKFISELAIIGLHDAMSSTLPSRIAGASLLVALDFITIEGINSSEKRAFRESLFDNLQVKTEHDKATLLALYQKVRGLIEAGIPFNDYTRNAGVPTVMEEALQHGILSQGPATLQPGLHVNVDPTRRGNEPRGLTQGQGSSNSTASSESSDASPISVMMEV